MSELIFAVIRQTPCMRKQQFEAANVENELFM